MTTGTRTETGSAVGDETQPLLRRTVSDPETAPEADRRNTSASIGALPFAVLLSGCFLANADSSFVVATFSSIASQFDDYTHGPWLLISYALGFTVALPTYGAFSDSYGRRVPLLAAYILFTVGCAVSGTASAMWQIIFGRVLSGAGGAGMTTMVAVIITDIATPSDMAVLRSYVNMFAVTGRSAGGPIGGILTDRIGWRWSFNGQAVLAILFLGLIAWTLPSIGPMQDSSNAQSEKKKRRVDVLGLLTFAAILISLLLIIDSLGREIISWKQPMIFVPSTVLAVSTVAFLVVEIFVAQDPLISISLLRDGGLGTQMFIQLAFVDTQFSIVSNMAPYFSRTIHASNSLAALQIAPVPVGNAIGAFFAGKIIQRTKRYKPLSIFGVAICSIGYGLVALRWYNPIKIWECLYMVLAGLGVGIVVSAQFVRISAAAPKDRIATAVSLFYLAQQIGLMTGTSSSAAVVQSGFRERLQELFPGQDSFVQRILNNINYAFSLPLDTQSIIISAYRKSFVAIPIISLCISVALQPFLIGLREEPLE